MVGEERSEGLLLRSSPLPRAQVELKLASGEQSVRVGKMKAGGNINQEFPPQDRPEFSEVVSNLEECLCNVEVHNSHPPLTSLWGGFTQILKIKQFHPRCVRLLGS